MIEARDLSDAIQLMSKHPAVKAGPCEIRPVDDLTEMIREKRAPAFKSKGRMNCSIG